MAHDVVVLGATVAGLTASRRLAAEGYDVVVLDPNLELRSAAIGHGVAAIGHAGVTHPVLAIALSAGLPPLLWLAVQPYFLAKRRAKAD